MFMKINKIINDVNILTGNTADQDVFIKRD